MSWEPITEAEARRHCELIAWQEENETWLAWLFDAEQRTCDHDYAVEEDESGRVDYQCRKCFHTGHTWH